MAGLRSEHGERSLVSEIQILTIALSTAIIFVVQISSMFAISYSMGSNLRQEALRVADELAVYLSEPMYNIDDRQSRRIAEALLVSGRLSGIELTSQASGTLISEMRGRDSRYVLPIKRDIFFDDYFLGSVTLHYSDEEINATIGRFLLIGMLVMLAVILVNVFVNRLLLRRRIVRSLSSILRGIDLIREGDYASRIELSRYADVNVLVNLINGMSESILAKSTQLVEANALLERRVAERTEELSNSLDELKMAQDRLIESGKLSALGLLSAGMAHELNTPLGAILSSNRNIIDFLDDKIGTMRDFLLSLSASEFALYERAVELGSERNKTLDLPETSRAIQRAIREGLENMGVSDARGVADYLVDLGIDPEDGVIRPLLTQARSLEILGAASDLLITRRMAEIVDVAGKKASAVVSALRFYLSPENEDMEGVVDIDGDIDKILTLMHNMLKHGVTVQHESSGARTRGSSDKLGQVWMNIIRNAAQAMEFKGELVIRSEIIGSLAVVSFVDSGPGIPDNVRPRIFDPFFTTKKQGEGMGLGLDICRRIVEAHNGTIDVESRPGRTSFRVSLPSI